jgi:hypothetical protein
MRRHSLCLSGLLTISFLVGCPAAGPTPEVVPPLEPVSGKVTLDGKPVEGVAVPSSLPKATKATRLPARRTPAVVTR